MDRTHYEVLGVKKGCSPDEIRSAYRRLVLEHHPDRSSAPASADLFLNATEAYHMLIDRDKRAAYDRLLVIEEQRRLAALQKQAAAKRKPEPPRAQAQPTRTAPPKPSSFIAADVVRLTLLFTRSRFVEAESLAHVIIDKDPRQPIPYAILGDLMRGRGKLAEAAKMYAFAVQMDPRNAIYQRRYEELLGATQASAHPNNAAAEISKPFAPLVGFLVVLVACVYVMVGREMPAFPGFSPLSSWTLGLMGMLFFSGIAIGASLSLGNMLDRFQQIATTSLGRASPTVTLGVVALFSFWAVALLYVAIGLSRKAFNYSTSRAVTAVASATLFFTMAASVTVTIHPTEVLLWGGNVIYTGTLVGWLVADAFR